jgi:Flp pilus assembly protein TadG
MRHNGRRQRGATLVETALVAPLLLALVFGVIDFGFAWSRQIAVRNGTHAAARAAAVNEVGADSSCALAPAPGSAGTAKLMCLAKARSGLPASSVRVRVALGPDGQMRGRPVVVCTQYYARSLSGLYRGILDNRLITNRSEYRIEFADPSAPIVTAEESTLAGNWDWCVA